MMEDHTDKFICARREFFKLVIGTACAAVPLATFNLLRKFPGDATANEVNEFLFVRGLRPCPHSYHSSDEEFGECTGITRRSHGLYCINADSVVCQNCGERRRFYFNSDGLRIWRCGNCERKDILAYLRREYGGASSIQFTANMKKANANT